MPYGSDVAVPSRTRSLDWRHGLMLNYPELGRHEERRIRSIEYFTRHADYIIACLVHLETLPRWDLLTIHYYPIDTDAWSSTHDDSGHDGRTGPVSVLHAPNHRALKGTDALIRACAELRAEGVVGAIGAGMGDATLLTRLVEEAEQRAVRSVNEARERLLAIFPRHTVTRCDSRIPDEAAVEISDWNLHALAQPRIVIAGSDLDSHQGRAELAVSLPLGASADGAVPARAAEAVSLRPVAPYPALVTAAISASTCTLSGA